MDIQYFIDQQNFVREDYVFSNQYILKNHTYYSSKPSPFGISWRLALALRGALTSIQLKGSQTNTK